MWRLLSLITCLAATPACAEGFKQAAYRDGVIYPADVAARDAALIAFYEEWKALYLIEGCGEERAYVGVNADGKRVWGGTADKTITVSEAHGYGMLALVMMADADPDAQRLFDAMVRYWQDHPAASDPGLMAWNQVEGCANAGKDVGGDHSATDGDLDIAYAFLLAEKTWGKGEFDYGALGRQVAAAVLRRQLIEGGYLSIGDWATGDGTYGGTTRSSDFMPSHFRAFAAEDARWTGVTDATYAVIAKESPAATGLFPDFITGLPDAPQPASPEFLEGEGDGMLSWNAARTPWRIALDDILNGEPRAAALLKPFNAFIKAATAGDPMQIADTYRLDGSVLNPGQSGGMTFTAMFAVAAMADPEGGPWLSALWTRMLATSIAEEDYFGNTLKLMAMITLAGHWQQP
jgi:endoglucanase